ncbi:hypothetical protein [Pseudomonas sp. LRF_L74]|uniref:hypothetical protein n=1 Tax=Pseudomonas sp. LRF_L74 TaxID=3369422 RepID=UPI003F624895
MSRHDLSRDEQALLDHYRQHSQGQPSPALDALILDAARQAVEPSLDETPRPDRARHGSFAARWRWPAAFASLATLVLGLGLTWRTLDEAPKAYDQAVPMSAPAPAPVAPAAAEAPRMSRKMAAPEARMEMQSSAPAMADESQKKTVQAAPAGAPRPGALQDALRQVLVLRRQGDEKQADALLASLRERYPAQQVEAELLRMQVLEKTPAGSR